MIDFERSFSHMFNELMYSKGCSKREIADTINVTTSTISRYATGRGVPSKTILKRIADFFDVDVSVFFSNYLVENQGIESYKELSTVYFSTKLKKLMKENNFSQATLAKKLKLSRQTVNYYTNGIAYPRPEIMKNICEVFDVKPSYFSCEAEAKENIVFYVEKVPKSFENCQFAKYFVSEDKTSRACSLGGDCDIKNGKCTHLCEFKNVRY